MKKVLNNRIRRMMRNNRSRHRAGASFPNFSDHIFIFIFNFTEIPPTGGSGHVAHSFDHVRPGDGQDRYLSASDMSLDPKGHPMKFGLDL